ncbi:3-hydroxyanthranilate 3,4-dioxygenase [Etheostoma cragini]|uniref:3-hydroxyanthranilate 3,4-dioxygenase n=1 Tax=Etheostoma cragini TaxID=417921 RepID=UPI00155DEFE6|nr:3-hydroxyanthranilate 3,4-dioxygenase [Etheostoma cragini]XP_034754725.1 3-hydroxyanthranilate 3,4-dioxygenase [Etheostoma cragini]XP_034754727.1 3-hydroxyanthranilate 3,4-dioxygenase [Etheostoma cragini]
MSNIPPVLNVEHWIAENKNAFLPPVCNKLMHFSQLNVMFVGGPNTRKDYHIEEGEELFYQVKGDMCLKLIENGKHKDVHIKEGEMFLLPARIPHSPQRQANTVGLVVERRRLLTETDCLRYYVDNTTDILFEKWFYCEDLGTQLLPIITEFMTSQQGKTGRPDPNEVFREPPFQMNPLNVMLPFSFKDWLDKQRPSLASGRPVDMFGAQFETEAIVFGPGRTETTVRQSDVWIWQLEGSSRVSMNEQEFSLSAGDSLLIPGHVQYLWQREEGTVALFVVQNPERKRP